MEPNCERLYLISPADVLCITEKQLTEDPKESVYEAYIQHERTAESLGLWPWHQI